MLQSKIRSPFSRLTSGVIILCSGGVAIVEMARVTSRTSGSREELVSVMTGAAAYCQIVPLPL